MQRLLTLGPGSLSVGVALFIVIALNGVFWSQMFHLLSPLSADDWLLLASFFVFSTAVYLFVLRALALPYLLKPLSALLVLLGASAWHFMAEYGAVIDSNMIRNVLQTNPSEARDLMTPAAFARIIGFGVVPAIIIFLTPVRWPAWKTLLRRNLVASLAGLAVVAANFGAMSAAYFSIFRENREIPLNATPANVVISTSKLIRLSLRQPRGPVAAIGEDARVEPAPTGRPLVSVVIVGETARAANFSLLGYRRQTNPQLEQTEGVISFMNVSSCGTDTAYSVPCMFSGLGRARYTFELAQRRENVLDVARRSGLDVVWVENQDGCKGVCDRVPNVTLTHLDDSRFCNTGECHDEILLDGLEERISSMRNGGVIVLHMMGSHGPAYYKRVPKEFALFQPICETSQFARCTSEQIVNSYDNTIVYTDHVLASVAKILAKAAGPDRDTMMLYISDHGESLGEHGVYLHGMPHAIAPDVQKHVPMVMWLSPGALQLQDAERVCLAEVGRKGRFSHDNLFHTLLGAHRIRTSLYDARLDVLESCREHLPM